MKIEIPYKEKLVLIVERRDEKNDLEYGYGIVCFHGGIFERNVFYFISFKNPRKIPGWRYDNVTEIGKDLIFREKKVGGFQFAEILKKEKRLEMFRFEILLRRDLFEKENFDES